MAVNKFVPGFGQLTIPGIYGFPNGVGTERKRCEALLKHKWVKHRIHGKGVVIAMDDYRHHLIVSFREGKQIPDIREIYWDELEEDYPQYHRIWLDINV